MSRRILGRAARWVLPLAAIGLLMPSASVQPASISLTTVQTAKEVDFGADVLWVLVLGSDSRPGQVVTEGRTDAIQLVGINTRRGAAVGIGIPRDSWVDLPGVGFDRINTAVSEGGPDLAARAVADLVGITPDLVLVTGFEGFESMLGVVGDVEVDSPTGFTNDEVGLTVRRGTNTFDAGQALDYARTRKVLPNGDFDRSANQQRLMLGVLQRLRVQQVEEGFMERSALAAIGGLETDLSPTEIYRFAQAVTQVDPRLVTACVIGGTPGTEFGASVVYPDRTQARRLGDDARRDAVLRGGC